jgi:hypothetical protein
MPIIALLLTAAVVLGPGAQSDAGAAAEDRTVRSRIAAFSSALQFSGTEPVEPDARDAKVRQATDRVRALVDEYVKTALKSTEGSNRIEHRLRSVLADHQPNPEYADAALARVAELRAGTSLIVAYTLVRGPHHDIATIRGYHWNVDRFELAGTADDDFDGFNMFKAELRSPVTGEFWMLAWGQAHTFNGKKVRCRVYAFDGQVFRTMWSPDDMFDATVRITEGGFSVEHRLWPERTPVRDEYTLTLNGPVKK